MSQIDRTSGASTVSDLYLGDTVHRFPNKPTMVLEDVRRSGKLILITGTLINRGQSTPMKDCSVSGNITDNYNLIGPDHLIKKLQEFEDGAKSF